MKSSKSAGLVVTILFVIGLGFLALDFYKDKQNYNEQIKLEESIEKEKTEKKEEIEKSENKDDKNKESEDKKCNSNEHTKLGQCYDCGEYYPVNKMTFNGRSYHCGCIPCSCCGLRYKKDQMEKSLFSDELICGPCREVEEFEYEEWQHQEETGKEITHPMCSNCGERPAVYVESELCEECAETTNYQYGDSVGNE